MHFKLIITICDTNATEQLIDVARITGSTGETILPNVDGVGLSDSLSFLDIHLYDKFDMVLFVVEEHIATNVLETLNRV